MKENNNFSKMIEKLRIKLFNGLKRYPVSIVMAAAASVIGVILIHSENISKDNERLLISMILALIIGFLFALTIKTIIESNTLGLKIRWFLWIVVGTFSMFYAIYLYNFMENMEMFEMVRFSALILAGFVLFTTAVFRKKTANQEVYSTLSGWRLAITTIYTLVIWGGISLILFAIEELLGVDIDEKAYMDTIVIAMGFFAPVFFFGGIPKTEEKLEPDRIYKFFKILVIYVIAPLLTAYTVVFYIYALRILFNWTWPDGVVGNMVLWYAIIGTVAMYFLRGMDGESKWAVAFGKWFPRIVIMPIILLFIALVMRINAYGFTANRYFLGAAGVWTLGCALYMSIVNYKKRRTRFITVSLVVIVLLSVLGPWNAISVGRISQINRLEKLLVKNNILVNGVIQKNSTIPDETKGAITGKLEYLEHNYDYKGVDFLPEEFTLSDMKEVLGFEYTYDYAGLKMEPGEGRDIFINEEILGSVVEISGYDYIWDSDTWVTNGIETDRGRLDFSFVRDEKGSILEINLNETILYTKKMDEFMDTIKASWDSKGKNITIDDMTFMADTPQAELKIVFTGVEIYPDDRGFEVGWMRFYILVKMK